MSEKSASQSTPSENSQKICFSDLSLSDEVQQAITSAGYEVPSPIQARAIPHLLNGEDILGVAQTGTGKTAAFALPLLSNLDFKQKAPQILCLAPTRELAIQVAEAFKDYAKHIKGFKVLAVYGGTGYRDQIMALNQGVHVVVGTPGRLMDHIEKKKLKLNEIKALVLDEADEMLRMGFIDDVEWILEHMPKDHQTALFSATMPKQIKNITKKYLQDPVEIAIKSKTTTGENIHQTYVQLRNHEKLFTLGRILEVEETEAVIVFSRTKAGTQEVAQYLQAEGYKAEALNGDVAQDQREKIVARLKNGTIDVVTATDVAARGLDVKRISHVINFDAPSDVEIYTHRIGRTGRAGRSGEAILFVNGGNKRLLSNIERVTRQKIDGYNFPSVKALNERKAEKLFARIDSTLQKDITDYESMIAKYLERQETEIDSLRLAAAFASLEAGGKPFYLEAPAKQPKTDRHKKGDKRDKRENREARNDRRGRDSAREKNDKHKRPERQKSNGIPMETYRLSVGETHGVGKGDIVGAIANEAGMDAKHIGTIDLRDSFSYVQLPAGMPTDVFKDLQKVWVRGHQLKLKKEMGDEASGKGGKRQERSSQEPHDKKSKKRKPKKPKKPKANKKSTEG